MYLIVYCKLTGGTVVYWILQKYGVAEGKGLSELRAMAKEAGEECPGFTPPGGETLDQVRSPGACDELANVTVAEI